MIVTILISIFISFVISYSMMKYHIYKIEKWIDLFFEEERRRMVRLINEHK